MVWFSQKTFLEKNSGAKTLIKGRLLSLKKTTPAAMRASKDCNTTNLIQTQSYLFE